MYTRKEYLNDCGDGAAAHRKYYGQFVDSRVRNFVETCFGKAALMNAHAKGEHFNTIPLNLWDGLYPLLRSVVGSTTLKLCGDYWTLSGAVCIAKEAALQVVERELEKPYFVQTVDEAMEYIRDQKEHPDSELDHKAQLLLIKLQCLKEYLTAMHKQFS